MIRDLVLKNRSYRRFHEDEKITKNTLIELVDLARLSASAANLQPLKYILSSEKKKNAKIFESLAWAAYLKDWKGPEKGEHPSAYIILLRDNEIAKSVICDQGIAAQSILLGAVDRGYGGCMMVAVNKAKLTEDLKIPERYSIEMVIALGKPKETVTIDPTDKSGEIKYWRDDHKIHHVPKRAINEIILKL